MVQTPQRTAFSFAKIATGHYTREKAILMEIKRIDLVKKGGDTADSW